MRRIGDAGVTKMRKQWLSQLARDDGQSFAEFALILILIAIVVLAILLIMGDDMRVWIITAWQSIFPSQ
jgi:Flp pilus assembly pilin Flp